MEPELLLHFANPNDQQVNDRIKRLEKKATSARKRRLQLKESHESDIHKISHTYSVLKSIDWTLSKQEIKQQLDCLIEFLES